MIPTSTFTAATLTEKMRSELEGWRQHLAERTAGDIAATALSGQPWIVYCDGGLALRIQGNTATPVSCAPGLFGISHFDRSAADTVARLRGAPYRVVFARDVPALRIAELESLLAWFPGSTVAADLDAQVAS